MSKYTPGNIKFFTGNRGKYRDAKIAIEIPITSNGQYILDNDDNNTDNNTNNNTDNNSDNNTNSASVSNNIISYVVEQIANIDPPEIQHLDCAVVAADKYDKVRATIPSYKLPLTNIMVEDTGLYIGDYMCGFPGAFIKFMIDSMTVEGIQKVYAGLPAIFRSAICINIGYKQHTIMREVAGHISKNIPSGDNGYGFDPIFIPDDGKGNKRSLGEMTDSERLQFSARSLACCEVRRLLYDTKK